MKRPSAKKMWEEFRDFYAASWQRNWKLTAGVSAFLLAAAWDEVHEFLHGDGTAYLLYELAKSIIKLL